MTPAPPTAAPPAAAAPAVPRALAVLECLLVTALLCAPGALLLLGERGHAAVRDIEKRRPAPPPAWQGAARLPTWLHDLQPWFDDALPLRGAFTRASNRALLTLGESGAATTVVGRDGWFFLDRTVDDHRRTRTLPPRRFERMLAATRARADWLAAQGTHYVLLVPPNKASVYPAQMPATLPAGTGPTLKDRFVERLAEPPSVAVLDLRAALVAAARDTQVYYRTDSHWNLAGALVGLDALHRHVAARLPGFSTPDWSGFALRWRPFPGGDLVQALGLEHEHREAVPFAAERWNPDWRDWQPPPGRELPAGFRVRVFDHPDGHGTALFLHDSFGAQLLPWIGKPFARFLEVTRGPDGAANDRLVRELVLAERPDVLVEELVERAFNASLPDDPDTWR